MLCWSASPSSWTPRLQERHPSVLCSRHKLRLGRMADRRARVPTGAPPGFIDTGATNGAVRPLAPAPPLLGAGTSAATYGLGGMQPYHP